jgi:hypothetical protein
MTKDEVDEEIKLASGQKAYSGRMQKMIELDQNHKFCAQQVNKIEENKHHRSEQRIVLVQIQTITIQRVEKREGYKNPVMVM